MSEMKKITLKGEIHAGNFKKTRDILDKAAKEYPEVKKQLDLSEVTFMDSKGFRVIFNYLSFFPKITPPNSKWVIKMYNTWLDGKKNLEKNN